MISVRELGTPAPMAEFLLDTPAALIESIPGKVHDMEGVSGCAFEPGESTHRDDLDALAPSVRLGGQPGFEDPLGAALGIISKSREGPRRSRTGVTSKMTVTYLSPYGVSPPVRLVRQAPGQRVTTNTLTPAASTPPVLTSNTARQHCMVWPNALARHLQPQAIQAREGAQVRAIKDSIGHVEVFRMDGVGISIIGRPRPLPGHDTPNPAHNTYTLKCEEPLMRVKRVLDLQLLVPAMQRYARSKDRDLVKLMNYARKLGVERKIRTYLEILL